MTKVLPRAGADDPRDRLAFLRGATPLAERMRAHDWSETPLGPPERWPGPLRTLVELMLGSRQPMFMAWGAAQTWLYNDAFVPILGRKHPSALGRAAMDVWGEARAELEPLFARVFAGESVHMDDIELQLDRRGRLEESHFAFSYNPVHDAEGRVAGLFGVCIETTEQVLARRDVQERQVRQRRMFEQAPGFIATLGGPDHVFEFANAAYVRFVGDRPLIGVPVRAAFPELEGQEFFELLDRVYETGERHVASGVPIRLRTAPDGGFVERRADFIYAPITAESGAVTGIFVEGHDVTEAYRAQQELRANERRQALLVELNDRFRELEDPADLSYAAAEILGRALEVSRAGYGTVDLEAETITIERDWNAPGTNSLAGVLHFRNYGTYIEDLKRGETVVFADADLDPRTRDTAAALKAIHAQAVVNMPITEQAGLVALLYLNHAEPREWKSEELAFVRDVADRTRIAVERRRASQALVELAASLERQVAERTAERDRVWRNSRDLLVVVGLDGVVRAVNPAWTRVLGHATTDVVGRGFLEFVWPEDHDRTEAALAAAVEHDLVDFATRYRHRDGSPRWLSWQTAVEEGIVYAYGRDITAQREQAEALELAESALRQSQKLEAMGQLTGGVAHDFNNLLAVVSNNLHLHRRLSPACREAPQLAAIARAVEGGARLTRQLLAFSRRQALRPEVLDLAHELEDLAQVLRVTLGSRIAVELDVARDVPPVRIDRSELELALLNLAMNARDAMPNGGRLHVALRRSARGDAEIEVSDTGHGIPPELLARVLEPFFSTKGPGRGTGLGLSQAYGFATQAGGTLAIRSEPGVSTTVTMTLPASAEVPAAARTGGEPGHTALRARVLLVEDNLEVGSATRDLLQYAGCEVTYFTSGDQARAFLDARPPGVVDLVVSDVVMPGATSGIALAEWIARERPRLPVVLATGHSAELRDAVERGHTVLQKPVEPETLLEAMRAALAPGRR